MREPRVRPGDPRELWPEDAELGPLVRHAWWGDQGALEALLTRLRTVFEVFFTRRLGWDAAEDLVQDALLRVLRALPRIDPDRAGRYVARVAQNLLRSACRRRARDARRFVPLELAANVESPVTADGEAQYQDLVGAIERVSAATLSPKLRDCVLGRLRDLSPAEIAVAEGTNPATLRARLRLARARLRIGASAPGRYVHRTFPVLPPLNVFSRRNGLVGVTGDEPPQAVPRPTDKPTGAPRS